MNETQTNSISSLLIANRGEIAVRIIRTARKMGIRTIAVYSQADNNAPHVHLADEAIAIGPSPAAQSYLSIDAIIAAAQKCGAQAIHPGYGFLSENADFALACQRAGLIFVGPSIEAIRVMGNKAAAKEKMAQCGVATIPGYEGDDQSTGELVSAAKQIGFPIMIKAAFGGGGRGMRIARNADSLETTITQAREEAASGFGDGQLILEKAISRARHIEFQILGDSHGNLVHLGERDCSLQRRHQKIIEEAPSPAVDMALRAKMAAAAIAAAQSICYVGAGTVEFLLDETGEFYFLEMNTRLQVEHPVSEMITGIDLVAWQIRIAGGEALDFGQDDIQFNGHAIEARLYAEDPDAAFSPSFGRVEHWRKPCGEYIRVDSGICTGQVIGPYYDAMVAKIIAFGDDRNCARAKLTEALTATELFGPQHNGNFLLDLLECKTFSDGNATTTFVDDEFTRDGGDIPEIETACKIVALEISAMRDESWQRSNLRCKALLNWSSCKPLARRFLLRGKTGEFELRVVCREDGNFEISSAQLDRVRVLTPSDIKGDIFMRAGDNCYGKVDGRDVRFKDISRLSEVEDSDTKTGHIAANMHGILVSITVKPGDKVKPESVLGTIEAMKMRHDIVAGVNGVVGTINQLINTQIAAGDVLFEIDLTGEKDETSV